MMWHHMAIGMGIIYIYRQAILGKIYTSICQQIFDVVCQGYGILKDPHTCLYWILFLVNGASYPSTSAATHAHYIPIAAKASKSHPHSYPPRIKHGLLENMENPIWFDDGR